jgi:sugar porter (SP) family MFS transporter
MQDEELSGVSWDPDILVQRPALRGAIVSAAALGAFLMSVYVFRIDEDMSCKRELQIGSCFYIFGALLQITTCFPESPVIAMTLLFLGRLVYGLGIGISMHAAPVYLGEMSPHSVRGIMLSLKEAANTVGVLIGYHIGNQNSQVPGGWVCSFAFGTSFAAASLLLSLFLPESSRWLLLRSRDEEALQSLHFVFPNDEQSVNDTFDEWKAHRQQRRAQKDTYSLWDVENRRALVIGVGIVLLQQLTGAPAMLAYASTVFEKAGRATNSSEHMATIQLITTMISVALVDRLGRRLLLFVGCTSMTLALIVLLVCFGQCNDAVSTAMFAYIGGFQFGFGPVVWLIVAEVFSNEIRGQAVALCVQVNFSSYGIVQFLMPIMSDVISFNGTFAIFGILSAYRYVPLVSTMP